MGRTSPPANPIFVNARTAHGWRTQEVFCAAFGRKALDLGMRLSVSVRQVRRWESASPPWPGDDTRRVLNAMFSAPVDALGFAPPPYLAPAPTTAAESEPETDDVNRRTFVTGTLAATAPGVFAPLPSSVDTKLGPRVGPEHIAQLHTSLAGLDAIDDAHGGSEVRTIAVRHLARVRRLINTGSYDDPVGHELQWMAGELAERCAWLSFDSSLLGDALAFWGEALTTADVIADAELKVKVLASMALHHIAYGRPRDALNLLRAAQRVAGRDASPSLRSLLAVRESRALFRLGDPSGAAAAMAGSLRVLDDAPREPEPGWLAFHGRAEIAFAQGRSHAEAGRAQAAAASARHALDQCAHGFARNSTLYRVELATRLISAGEADEACEHARLLAAELPEVASERVREGLRGIAYRLDAVDAAEARATADMIRTAAREATTA